MMPALYTYRLAVDHGSAPNPFGGVCTLVICKPAIRRCAEPGDWVVGTGSANSPLGNMGGSMVYAMRVTRKMTMREYDAYCRSGLRIKLPDWTSGDPERMAGDCIYDFSRDPPRIRKSVHAEKHRDRDLGGQYVLLSDRFLYLGRKARPLPQQLLPVICSGRGHRSKANQPFVKRFEAWIAGLPGTRNGLRGRPLQELTAEETHVRGGRCRC